ncbi:MAG TPA: SOS response-associated peptidase family protein, partial [Anaeromyxobacteraceae bacterium]|nr:SOS response-associated peptidase family protein [Anaeromyxobacteraceae bacterium]
MCGRFTLTTADVGSLARRWAAEVEQAAAAAFRPRYNVAPGDPHLVLRAEG